MIAGRIKLVIFDCDGVLVDSEPIINRAHAEVLTACGYPITQKVLVERFCGMSDPDMLEIIERRWGCALPVSICRAKPYDGGGPLPRHRGQPCGYRCRPRRRHDRNRLRRWEPLWAGARGSSAKTPSRPDHGSHARTGDHYSETRLSRSEMT